MLTVTSAPAPPPGPPVVRLSKVTVLVTGEMHSPGRQRTPSCVSPAATAGPRLNSAPPNQTSRSQLYCRSSRSLPTGVLRRLDQRPELVAEVFVGAKELEEVVLRDVRAAVVEVRPALAGRQGMGRDRLRGRAVRAVERAHRAAAPEVPGVDPRARVDPREHRVARLPEAGGEVPVKKLLEDVPLTATAADGEIRRPLIARPTSAEEDEEVRRAQAVLRPLVDPLRKPRHAEPFVGEPLVAFPRSA